MVLDLELLNKFFHAEVLPERKPLRVLENHQVGKDISLYKFGKPVEYISLSELRQNSSLPYLEFSKVEISQNEAGVDFRYPIEGVKGSVRFLKQKDTWIVKDQNLVEH